MQWNAGEVTRRVKRRVFLGLGAIGFYSQDCPSSFLLSRRDSLVGLKSQV